MNISILSLSAYPSISLRSMLWAGLATGLSFSANAATLAYEGFNYGSTGGSIDGTAVGGGAFGLTGSYTTATGASGNGNVQASNYTPSGLSFSGFLSNGGALSQTVQPTMNQVKEFTYSHVPFDISATGNVYQSLLVNVTANNLVNATLGQNPSNSGVTDIRVQETANILGNGNGAMNISPKRSNQNGVRVGANYGGSGFISGSQAINLNQTYLFISQYTNVGGVDGGAATLWVFDEASFDSWMTDGSGLESELSNYAIIETSNSSSSSITLDSTKSMRIATSEFSIDFNSGADNYDNTGEISVIYDEVRYGNSLGDVISVPEPATYAWILGGAMLGWTLIRRQRRN